MLRRVIDDPEGLIGAFTGMVMLSVVTLGVFCRYVLQSPIQATEEIALACFVWMVFIGASAACRHGLHAGVDALVVVLPASWQRFLRIVSHLTVMAVATVGFVAVGWSFAQVGWITRSMTTDIALFWVYVSVPIGGCLVIWRTGEHLVAEIRQPRATSAVPSGSGELL